MSDVDLTRRVERMAEFEQRAGVELRGLYASLDDNGYLTVNGEAYSNSGDELGQDVVVKVVVQDADGRVIGKADELIDSGSFFSFEPFSILVSLPARNISKIKVFPKLSS